MSEKWQKLDLTLCALIWEMYSRFHTQIIIPCVEVKTHNEKLQKFFWFEKSSNMAEN